jgi:long-chain acyl-CoA synthetase
MIVTGERIEIPKLRLYDMLANTAARYPHRRATIFAGHELTYEQLHRTVLLAMRALADAGVEAGDRIGIMLPNCPQYVIAFYAVTGLGAAVVQVNPMSTGSELLFLLQDSGCKILIVYDPLLPVVQSVRSNTALERVIAVRFAASETQLDAGDVWFDELLASATGPGQPADFDPEETLAVLQYTGGTTGRPKGAMLTHQNLVANAVQADSMLPGGITDDDVMVCALPLFHVYAMTVCMNYPVYTGTPILLVPRFNPQELVELIQKYRATLFPGVPTMYVALSQVLPPGSDALKSLRVCNSGGAPMPVKVMESFERLTGAQVLEGYGLSEASPITHTNPSVEKRKVGSIGLPAPNTEARIVSLEDSRTTLPVGEIGELAVRGPQVMKGYWNRPEETARTLVDGWLLTGDIARFDEDGYTYIVDRKKDMIIASGYNVYPREVEEVLYRHPAVMEAAVIGVPDEYRGETVKAVVVLKPGQTATESELREWCRQYLSAYKVPTQVEFRTELQKTAVGKILRRTLREEQSG